MYFKLNYASHLPLSAQIAYFLTKAIKEGVFNPTNQLPPIKEISEGLCVTPSIVRDAYSMLIESSLIERREGVGYCLLRPTGLTPESASSVSTNY